MNSKIPQLFIDLAKLTNVLHDGSEQAAGFSVRVSLRYESAVPGAGSTNDEYYDIPVRANKDGIFPDIEHSSPLEVINYVLGNYDSSSERLRTTFEFAEQLLDGMILRGQHFTWDTLTELGYKHQSSSYVTQPGGR